MTELEVYYPDGKPRPLLIFLVGALGCFPLDFSRALADDLKTGFFSADEERFRLIQQRDEFMPPKQAQKVKGDLIRERFAAFATDQLTSGHDVVADMFFNTPDTRQVPLAVAKKTGALSIALYANATNKIAKKRIQAGVENDSFVVPIDRWNLRRPESILYAMQMSLERPTAKEDIDVVMRLDGHGTTDRILDEVVEKFDSIGLLKAG